MAVLGSDFPPNPVFESDWACLITALLLFKLPHHFDPARILLESVWLLSFNDVAQMALLHLSKITLLLVELVEKESFVRCVVHVIQPIRGIRRALFIMGDANTLT